MALINGIKFTLGADPEFFVAKNGKPVSAYNLIPGDKKKPFKVPYGAVQVDGMALEFNIAPAAGEAGFLRNLGAVMKSIMDMVPGYEYYPHPVAEFGAEYIEAQPEQAKVLGCDPDFNAYTKKPNPTPDGKRPFRTAAGHIHIGWTDGVDPTDPGHFDACCILTKILDIYLGIPSLAWDPDKKRRELYGRAGAFRPKPYGMEYRTLSNAWVNHPKHKHLPKFIYNATIAAIHKAFEKPEFGDTKFFGNAVPDIINNSDMETLRRIFEVYSRELPMPSQYKAA